MYISKKHVTELLACVIQAKLENLVVRFGLKSPCTKAQLKQRNQMLPLQ